MNLTDLPRPFIRALLDALEPGDGRSLLFASRSILKVLSEVKPVALARWGTTAEGPTLEQLLGMSVVGALLLPDGSNDFELSPQLQLDGLKTAVLSYRYQSIFCCVSSNALHGVSDETLPHAAAAACAFTTHIIPYNSSHVVLVKQQHPNTLQPSHVPYCTQHHTTAAACTPAGCQSSRAVSAHPLMPRTSPALSSAVGSWTHTLVSTWPPSCSTCRTWPLCGTLC